MPEAPARPRPAAVRALTVLRTRDFGLFCCGYATSLLGSSMAGVAVAFAVLDGGGGPARSGSCSRQCR
ncbi:hypothetical protein [Streptacidiphilus pinicola]|uniref:hypothetical protein n=1 Tax=Streptacidiphilus pinicola TaxID=2219663 RepID=UPI0014035D2D|nr:hypothetical protein [Streptacidiphilus pinicola]